MLSFTPSIMGGSRTGCWLPGLERSRLNSSNPTAIDGHFAQMSARAAVVFRSIQTEAAAFASGVLFPLGLLVRLMLSALRAYRLVCTMAGRVCPR